MITNDVVILLPESFCLEPTCHGLFNQVIKPIRSEHGNSTGQLIYNFSELLCPSDCRDKEIRTNQERISKLNLSQPLARSINVKNFCELHITTLWVLLAIALRIVYFKQDKKWDPSSMRRTSWMPSMSKLMNSCEPWMLGKTSWKEATTISWKYRVGVVA